MHVQPSVHSKRSSPRGTQAPNQKRSLTHTDKGKIYATGMFASFGDKKVLNLTVRFFFFIIAVTKQEIIILQFLLHHNIIFLEAFFI